MVEYNFHSGRIQISLTQIQGKTCPSCQTDSYILYLLNQIQSKYKDGADRLKLNERHQTIGNK